MVTPNIILDKKTATVQYKSSTTITAATAPIQGVKWSSSNVKIATVDTTGKVTTVGKGSVTITATTEDNLHSANCIVTVKLVWWQWIIQTILFGFLWY
ncbi:MAG: Ig-like domain-containing protein [Eubacteriales bacterium]